MVEKPLQTGRTSGVTDDPKMQSDRHHPRRNLPFAVQHVEAVAELPKILVCRRDRSSDKFGIIGWPSGFLRNYADHAMTETFQAAVTALQQSLRPRTALMCAEKSWADCHRQIICDYLIANGQQVTHLVDTEIQEDGRLSAFASVLDRKTLHYRANPAQLRLDV